MDEKPALKQRRSWLLIVLVVSFLLLIFGVWYLLKATRPTDLSSLPSEPRRGFGDLVVPARPLKIPTPKSEFRYEEKPIEEVGDFYLYPANQELGIGERLEVTGVVAEVPRWDSSRRQVVGSLEFPTAQGVVEATILFNLPQEKIGVRFAPRGDLEANQTWTTSTVGEVIEKIKTDDQLIVLVGLDEGARALLAALKGEAGSSSSLVIGPVIQLVVGDY
jgi:hypothetical protein